MKRLVAFLVLLFMTNVAMGYTTLTIQDDDTSVSVFFYAVSKDGDPNTSPVLGDYDLYYCKMGAAMSSVANVSALDTATSNWAANKAYHVGQGVIRVDVPDAAFAGAPGDLVIIRLVDVSGAAAAAGEDKFEPIYVQLTPPVQTHAMSTAYEALLSTAAEVASATNDAVVAGTLGTSMAAVPTSIWGAQISSYYTTVGSFAEALYRASMRPRP